MFQDIAEHTATKAAPSGVVSEVVGKMTVIVKVGSLN